jgi:hypothetical protein
MYRPAAEQKQPNKRRRNYNSSQYNHWYYYNEICINWENADK